MKNIKNNAIGIILWGLALLCLLLPMGKSGDETVLGIRFAFSRPVFAIGIFFLPLVGLITNLLIFKRGLRCFLSCAFSAIPALMLLLLIISSVASGMGLSNIPIGAFVEWLLYSVIFVFSIVYSVKAKKRSSN